MGFFYNTSIRLYNERLKEIEDVEIGDLVIIGPDKISSVIDKVSKKVRISKDSPNIKRQLFSVKIRGVRGFLQLTGDQTLKAVKRKDIGYEKLENLNFDDIKVVDLEENDIVYTPIKTINRDKEKIYWANGMICFIEECKRIEKNFYSTFYNIRIKDSKIYLVGGIATENKELFYKEI